MKVKIYKKKPVEVEVVEFDKQIWLHDMDMNSNSKTYPMVKLHIVDGFHPVIETLEGDMRVKHGDFIIKGVQGEYYPCKRDIFFETYEEVTE